MKKPSINLLFWGFVCVCCSAVARIVTIPVSRNIVNDANFESTGWETPYKDLVYITAKGWVKDSKWTATGSVYLSKNKAMENKVVPLRNKNFNGFKLQSITELKYSTYVKTSLNNISIAPALILQLDLGDDGEFNSGKDCQINFFPQFQSSLTSQPDVAMNQWQEWDALHGYWRFTPATDQTNIPEFGKNLAVFSLQEFKDYYQGISVEPKIVNADPASFGGGIKLVLPSNPGPGVEGSVGDYNGYEGFVDGLIVNFQTKDPLTGAVTGIEYSYDFEITTYIYKKWFITALIVAFIGLFGIGLFMYNRRRRLAEER
jgi:hypothetical protein